MAQAVVNTAAGAASVQGPPGVPTSLSATALGQTAISLTWSLSAAKPVALGVRVERSVDGGSTYAQLGSDLPDGTTAYTDSDLTPGSTYHYRVRALGRRVASTPSGASSATTDAPPAPTADFSAPQTTVLAGSTVPFTPVTSGIVTGYSWTVTPGGQTSTLASPAFTFSSAGSYTVSFTVSGPGGSDTETKVGYITVTAPADPVNTGRTINAAGNQLSLTFNEAVTGSVGVTLRDGTGVSLGLTYLSGSGTTTLVYAIGRIVYSGELPLATYAPGDIQSAVGGVPLAAFSNLSVTNQSTQQPVDPSVPTALGASAAVDGTQWTVSLSEPVTGHGGFSPSMSGGPVALTYVSGEGTDTLIFSGSRTVLEGETGTLAYTPGSVVDVDGHPLAAFSGLTVANGSQQAAPAPSQPSALTVLAASDTEVAVSWDLADANDTAVTLQRSLDGSTGWVTITALAGGHRCWTDRSCYPATAYHYRVRASNATGDSAWSATATTTTKANAASATNTITGFSATKNSAWQVTLAWTMPSSLQGGASDVVIERSTDGGVTFEPVKVYASSAGQVASYADTPLRPATAYTYRIRSVGWGGYSAYAGPATATTDAVPSGFPDCPAGLSAAVVSATQTVLTWVDRAGGLATYKVETAPIPGTQSPTDATWTQVGETTVGATAYTLATQAKTPVFVRVRANRSGNHSAYEYVRSARDGAAIVPVRPCSAGSAADYHIGSGQTYSGFSAFFAAVGSAGPGPGSTVYVHPGTYHEKFCIDWRGRADARLTIQGVEDEFGNRPVIDFQNATTPLGLVPGNGSTFQDLSGILFHRLGNLAGHTPGFVTLRGLELTHTGSAGGTYVAADGSTRTYSGRANGVYVAGGDELVIEDCVIHGCANGVFAADNGTAQRQIHNLTLRDNYFYGNGTENGYLEHNTYLECQGEVYEGNRYGPLRATALGGQLKTRGVGVVVRYNRFDGGNLLPLGLVEHQNSRYTSWIAPAAARDIHVYGNLVVNTGAATNPLRFGGDQGFAQGFRKGTLYFSHNTLAETFDSASRTEWFQAYDAARPLVAINNVRYVSKGTPSGSTPGNVLFSTTAGEAAAVFGANWLSPNPKDVWSGSFTGVKQGWADITVSTTNAPDFVDRGAGDYRVLAGTEADGRGSRLPGDHPAVDFEPGSPFGTEARATWGAGSDLGCFAAGPDTVPPTVVLSNIDAFGGTYTENYSERVTSSGNGRTLTASGGAVALTYQSGSGTTSLVFGLSRTLVASESVTRAYSPGDTADLAGNPLAAYSGVAVTNGSEETSATGPGVRGATVFAPTGVVATATFQKPATAADGDLFQVGLDLINTTITPTPPDDDWVFVRDQLGGFSGSRFWVFQKPILDASLEPDSYDFGLSGGTYVMGALARIVGADLSAPLDAVTSAVGGSSATQTSPSVTTHGPDRLILRWLVEDRQFSVEGPPGHVVKVNQTAPFQFGGIIALAVSSQAVEGDTGTANFTLTSARPTGLVTVALKPA